MRVLFVARSLAHGGAERQLVTLAAGLRRRGHQIAIVTFYDDNPLAAALEGGGVLVRPMDKSGRWDVFAFLWRLIRFIRAWRPDVIHPYLAVPNLILSVLRPVLPRARLVWGIRATSEELAALDSVRRWIHLHEGRFAHLADAVIANSEAGKRHAVSLGYRESLITVIPNGIDGVEFRPDPLLRSALRTEWNAAENDCLIGVVARYDVQKGHRDFLRAAAIVASTPAANHVRFVLIGTGRQPELLLLAGKLGITERLLLLPMGGDIVAMYNALDVVVSSSTMEGFSNAVAEAMACGTPVVVTDVGDSRIIAGDDRFVVPVRDPAALAAAIADLLTILPSKRLTVRERIVTEFSVERLVDRSERLLMDLVPR